MKIYKILICVLVAVLLSLFVCISANAESVSSKNSSKSSSAVSDTSSSLSLEGVSDAEDEEEPPVFDFIKIQGFAIVIAGTGLAAAFVLVRARLGRKVRGYNPEEDLSIYKIKK